jgi:hypothetical protein
VGDHLGTGSVVSFCFFCYTVPNKHFLNLRRIPLNFINCPFQIPRDKEERLSSLSTMSLIWKNEIRKNEKIGIKISSKMEQKSLNPDAKTHRNPLNTRIFEESISIEIHYFHNDSERVLL